MDPSQRNGSDFIKISTAPYSTGGRAVARRVQNLRAKSLKLNQIAHPTEVFFKAESDGVVVDLTCERRMQEEAEDAEEDDDEDDEDVRRGVRNEDCNTEIINET